MALLTIFANTPKPVWFVFGYLLYIGVKSLKDREVPISRLMIVPLVFISLKYKLLLGGPASLLLMYTSILIGATTVVALKSIHSNVIVLKNVWKVKLPGTTFTLTLFMSYFAVRYFFGALKSIDPSLYLRWSPFEVTVSGMFSGYLLGNALRFHLKARSLRYEAKG